MKTKLVVLTDNSNSTYNAAIIKLINENSAGYWHWYKESWIISDGKGRDQTWWRDSIHKVCSGLRFTVIKLGEDSNWSGFDVKDKFKWFHKNWKK